MEISNILQVWYKKNKRDLPWRETKNPYFIWLSEIILQQTKVKQGVDYYFKFIKKYPTIELLANSSEESILNLWQGLGYYSRARNLHFASKQIVQNYSGKLPNEYKELIKIKGIGKYTAAAILSIAYNKPFPVVDGNVIRVLSRLFGYKNPVDTSKGLNDIYDMAKNEIDKKEPGNYNQAIMDFGAMVCTPKNPDCKNCSLVKNCKAYSLNQIDKIPLKSLKTKQKIRYFNYLFFKNTTGFYIRKREKKYIWQNLYDFPLIETTKQVSITELQNYNYWKLIVPKNANSLITLKKPVKHILSHQIIITCFITIETDKEFKIEKQGFIEITNEKIENYPFPKLIEKNFKNRIC